MIKKLYKRIENKLKEERGTSMTLINISFILVILLFVILIFTMTTLFTLMIQSRRLIEEAVVRTIQNNYANVYHTSRESYSGGYLPNRSGFSENVIITNENVYSTLENNMGLSYLGNKTYARAGRNENSLYKIKNINLSIINQKIGSGTQNFTSNVGYTFVFPIKIFNYKKEMEVDMKVKAKYTGKF